jgi:hypothetical protein
MARIRSIKPEFCTSEQVARCSRDARLLFVLMWNFCDDQGIHAAGFMRLKMECFPADAIAVEAVRGWVNELIRERLLGRFEAGGSQYWAVTGWGRHQKIDKPTSRHPAWTRLTFDEHSTNDLGGLSNEITRIDESSLTARGALTPGVEGKGEERRGVEALARAKALAPVKARSASTKRSSKAKALPQTEALGGGDPPEAVDNSAELSVFGSDPAPVVGLDELLDEVAVGPQLEIVDGQAVEFVAGGNGKTPLQQACATTWKAYAVAYERRWGVAPLRSAKANSQILAFCKVVPQHEAPEVAAFFVASARGVYVAGKHDLNFLARDAAGLRTEWATGRQVMEAEARQGDRTAATGNVFADLIEQGRRLEEEEARRVSAKV